MRVEKRKGGDTGGIVGMAAALWPVACRGARLGTGSPLGPTPRTDEGAHQIEPWVADGEDLTMTDDADAADAGPDGGGVLLHRRTIEFDAYDDGARMRVTARLRDERPWAAQTGGIEHVHDMELGITVRKDDLTIESASCEMHRFPHAECPAITGAFGALVGLSVRRGYTKAVQERFGGTRGCTHLEQLARAIGPVVVQAATSARARARDWAHLDAAPSQRPATFPRDTCHVWAEGGPAQQKLAAGWRPGMGGYPAPPVDVIVRMGTTPA